MSNLKINIIKDSFDQLDKWICENEFKAYDPFDGLNAKYLQKLTFNNHYLRIALQQTVRRFPLNLRKLIGIAKSTSSKGMGFCALGYLNMYQATKDQKYLTKVKSCLDWLKTNYSSSYSGYAWGNHFSYESRGGCIPLGVPTIVWTSLIGNTFLNAFDILGEKEYFDVAKSASDFILNDIAQYNGSPNSLCFMYIPNRKPSDDGCIHNSNVLGASLLARIYKHHKDKKLVDISKKSINFTVEHQLPEGGWYYGEPKKFHWIDSFHSGYVLESIYDYINATNDRSYEDELLKGFRYFKATFFKKDGTPKYYNYKTYPIDIQCASQAIQTLIRLKEYDKGSPELAEKVALWTIRNMQDKKGYFYFRKYPSMINKTPMFHWGQATMLSGLSYLYLDSVSRGRSRDQA